MWPYVVWMIIVVGFLIYRHISRKAESVDPARRASDVRGARGEADVAAALHALLTEMCGKDFVLRHTVILTIARGTSFPTAEIDHLAITPFGVFVIETKAWRGQIMAGPNDQSLMVVSPAGETAVRKSPLTQNRSKVAFIQRLVPGELFIVVGAGVFSSRDTRLSPSLPLDLIGIGDLKHWLRGQLSSWLRRTENLAVPTFVDVAKIDRAIMKFADVAPDAAGRHKECVSR